MAKNSSLFLTPIIIFIVCTNIFGQEVKSYTTKRINGELPVLDGRGDDEIWKLVDWGGDFIQRMPSEGKPPSQKTSFKILYDDKNLFVLVRAYDTEPQKIVKRMSRRDGFEGDWVEINIDSYYDKRTAFSFTITAAGVKGDEYISNNGDNWDPSWDPIWYAKTSIDDEGWVAEMRIPLSQLRFSDKEKHIWGLQFNRRFFREEERSNWQPIAQNAGGWVHLFGELHGIEGIKPKKQVEVMPYILGKTERFNKEENNPYKTGRSSSFAAGVDGKIGITNDIILDFTINPDFGQVEADPSTVNLSAFQLFFNERRPFFIEGNNILNFPITQSTAGGPFTNDNLLYSRRIGRNPHHSPDTEDGEFVDQPNNTSIIGALKLTGKNKNGFSFGILESLTAEEKAEIDMEGQRRKEVEEPLTNYFVARAQQDYNKGKTVVGGMFTATNRKISDETLNFLHTEAYTAGFDFLHNWQDRKYYLAFNSILSRVQGDKASILESQTSSTRYFQRNDNSQTVDSLRTSLMGTGGTLKVGKTKGKVNFQAGVTYRSPELELNDIGFLRNADRIDQWLWVGYNFIEPFSIFRSLRINTNQYARWDFDGVNNSRSLNFNAHADFKNFWRFGNGVSFDDRFISNSDLRGGPSMTFPGGINYWFYLGTDERKKVNFNLNPSFYWGNERYKRSKNVGLRISYQPINALKISVNPRINVSKNELQYVPIDEENGVKEYVMGTIDQKTYSLSLRLTYNINPNLSIQFWGQPFNSRGSYVDFKKVTNSNASAYENRFHLFTNNEIFYDDNEDKNQISKDNGGTFDYSFENPNFNFVEFRSNLVMRWEYTPGSTLFLVWTQGRSDSPRYEEANSFSSITNDIFNVYPHNIFLLKYTYRFIL